MTSEQPQPVADLASAGHQRDADAGSESGVAIEHSPAQGAFRLTVRGEHAVVLRYREQPARGSAAGTATATWDILSTHADPKFQGTGVASVLVQEVFDRARAQGRRIVPTCPYIPVWVRRHPAEADLIEGPE